MTSTLRALRPTGYPDKPRGQRIHRERKRWYTVLSDPSRLFRPGARFGAFEVQSHDSGMLSGECFAEGTVLRNPDGKLMKVVIVEGKYTLERIYELP